MDLNQNKVNKQNKLKWRTIHCFLNTKLFATNFPFYMYNPIQSPLHPKNVTYPSYINPFLWVFAHSKQLQSDQNTCKTNLRKSNSEDQSFFSSSPRLGRRQRKDLVRILSQLCIRRKGKQRLCTENTYIFLTTKLMWHNVQLTQ
jgi:hypothetical protein